MLRKYFGEKRREDAGLLQGTFEAVDAFSQKLHDLHQEKAELPVRMFRMEMIASGFKDALNELEQSHYSAQRLGKTINCTYVEELQPEALDEYKLHVYFYKNALIRIFSTLDKLGHFLNDLFELETEEVKSRFSYFTVLRQMYHKKMHVDLEQDLFDLKKKYSDSMQKLRKRRNMEIHLMNVEMLDDLVKTREAFSKRSCIEDVQGNMDSLEQGFEMVTLSLFVAFTYAVKHVQTDGNLS